MRTLGILVGLAVFPVAVLLTKLELPLDEVMTAFAVAAIQCVVTGALIGRWWAPVVVVAQPWLYFYVFTNPPDDPESLKGIFTSVCSIALAIVVWIGVGLRRVARSKPTPATRLPS